MSPGIQIIAHRGASQWAPENTLAAVEMAWSQGCRAVEVDIQLSLDGRVMVIHDSSTARTAGTDWTIAETTAPTLRQLDVGRFKSPAFTGQRIPFLEEVLDTLPRDGRLWLDLKGDARLIPVLVPLLKQGKQCDRVTLIGFCLETLTRAKQYLPEVPMYWLRETSWGVPFGAGIIAQAREAGLDGLDLDWAGVTAGLVQAIRHSGLQLVVWTVDNLAIAQRLNRWGVQGITTNRPERVAACLPNACA